MTKADIIKHGLDCPDCDNSGMKVGGNESTGSEPEQCEWCHCYPGSKFQLSSDLDELLRETADKTLKDFMTWFDMQPEHKVMKDSSELIEDYWNSLTSPNTGDKK